MPIKAGTDLLYKTTFGKVGSARQTLVWPLCVVLCYASTGHCSDLPPGLSHRPDIPDLRHHFSSTSHLYLAIK